jgi:hypothetical protein
MSFKIMKMKAL